MLEIIEVTPLDKSLMSIILIGIILLVRKQLNLKSIKYASIILWSILFAYLLLPYSLQINVAKSDVSFNGENIYEIAQNLEYSYSSIIKTIGTVLYKSNRIIVATLLIFYVLFEVIKTTKAVKSSTPIVLNQTMKECLELFNLNRKVEIMVNDKIDVPITYGIIRPKIILQSNILKDEKALKYVIIHELTHIRKFDIIWNHLKYFMACICWYNPLVFAICNYIEEDLEILCDKLVLKKVGETKENKIEYMESMLKLIEIEEETKNKLPLKLHPNLERMKIMKKYKVSLAGILSLVFVSLISATSFANVKVYEDDITISSAMPITSSESIEINENNRTKEITDEEYNNLNLGNSLITRLRSANIDDSQTLGRYGTKEYSFDMKSWNTPYHDGFTTKISNLSCEKGVQYEVIIEENTREIYRETFDRATTLTTKAYRNSKYRVTIRNDKSANLKFDIAINTYVR